MSHPHRRFLLSKFHTVPTDIVFSPALYREIFFCVPSPGQGGPL